MPLTACLIVCPLICTREGFLPAQSCATAVASQAYFPLRNLCILGFLDQLVLKLPVLEKLLLVRTNLSHQIICLSWSISHHTLCIPAHFWRLQTCHEFFGTSPTCCMASAAGSPEALESLHRWRVVTAACHRHIHTQWTAVAVSRCPLSARANRAIMCHGRER